MNEPDTTVSLTASMWRPIETAPKDGGELLLYGEWAGEIHGPAGMFTIDIGMWAGGTSDYPGNDWWALTTGDAYGCWMRATHWMPLPDKPNGASAPREAAKS